MTTKQFYEYTVYSDGRIFKGEKEIKQYNNSTGYKIVQLKIDSKWRTYLVHRVIAICFLGLDVNTKMTVNHIDCNKSNNDVSNLEVVSLSDNRLHGVKNELYTNTTKRTKEVNGNKVLNTLTGVVYSSIRECASINNLNRNILWEKLTGRKINNTIYKLIN